MILETIVSGILIASGITVAIVELKPKKKTLSTSNKTLLKDNSPYRTPSLLGSNSSLEDNEANTKPPRLFSYNKDHLCPACRCNNKVYTGGGMQKNFKGCCGELAKNCPDSPHMHIKCWACNFEFLMKGGNVK